MFDERNDVAVLETPPAEAVEAVRVRQLQPDDVIVLRTPRTVSAEVAERMAHQVRSAFGEDRSVLVLGDDVKFDILARNAAPSLGAEPVPGRVEDVELAALVRSLAVGEALLRTDAGFTVQPAPATASSSAAEPASAAPHGIDLDGCIDRWPFR